MWKGWDCWILPQHEFLFDALVSSHLCAGPARARLTLRCLNLTLTLEPMEYAPTYRRPSSTNTPAGNHISRIVDAQINAANADRDRKQNRQAQKIDLEPQRHKALWPT